MALADCRLNIGDLASSLFFWNDQTRARWAFAYYGTALATPAPVPTPAEPDA